MGIWDRLGSVINSYLNDFGGQTSRGFKSSGDPDVDAAYDELNGFLNGEDTSREKKKSDNAGHYSWRDTARQTHTGASGFSGSKVKLPTEELRADFELLGVPFGADGETCKAAYKKLLKIHHPDRHTGHEGNYKKATEKSAKLNAAYDRIERWQKENE